jgi:glutaredoxin-related protein
MSDANTRIDEIVNKSDVVLFMKGTAFVPAMRLFQPRGGDS